MAEKIIKDGIPQNREDFVHPPRMEKNLIIGGGVIGVEMAETFSAMDTKVALIEAKARLLLEMEREVSQNMRMIFRKHGVELHVGSALRRIMRNGKGTQCIFTENSKDMVAGAQYVCPLCGWKASEHRGTFC